MRSRTLPSMALVALLLLGALAGPSGAPAAAEPVKQSSFHVQTFVDGSEEISGEADEDDRLMAEFEIPAGGQVFCATLQVSRVRYQVSQVPLSATPGTIWCGDIDDDAMIDDDLLVTYPDADRVEVLSLGGEPTTVSVDVVLQVPEPTAVTADDLDRDGDLDILVTSGSECALYIFEAVGVLTYAEARVVPVGPRPSALAAHDLDPDFHKDVVVANTGGSSVTVLLGRGDMTFYPKRIEVGRGPSAVQLRDIDRDLAVDMVVVESRNDTVSVHLNVGNGNFSNATVLQTAPGPVDVDVWDVNSDSLYDLVVACAGTNETWVMRQVGGGEFEVWEVLPAGRAPRAVGAYHLNRNEDFNRDIVTACSGSDNLTVYLADGSLNHTIAFDIEVGGRPVDMGVMRGRSGGEDLVVAISQVPPVLSVARPVALAELITVGFGSHTNLADPVELPEGTECAEVSVLKGLGRYVSAHRSEASGGVLRVHMEVSARRTGWVRLSDLNVWVTSNRVPRADAGRDVKVLVGEPVLLNASASYDQDGDPLEYLWFVGSGDMPDHTANVSTHVFTEPGEHFVFLIVRDPWGNADQDTVTVLVNAPPVARGVVPAFTTAREPTRLSAHLSEDPDGTIVDYIWDYSLGVVHGRTVDVLFTGSGLWNVTLEVVDDQGARTAVTYEIEVKPSTEPLRPPGEQVPGDQGQVPGPGAMLSSLALLAAAAVSMAVARRRIR